MSKAQIDRLGNRLRDNAPIEEDVKLLDEYRRSFSEASEHVLRRIQNELGLEPTARPAKSTASLVDKLRRETIRLTQIQDIAGCRVVITDVGEQERVVGALKTMFPDAPVVDRREHPSYGYRSVHVIPKVGGMAVEIQVRTLLQHRWAELSEKLADRLGAAIKYGGGPDDWRKYLGDLSSYIAQYETAEARVAETVRAANNVRERMEANQAQLKELKERIRASIELAVSRL